MAEFYGRLICNSKKRGILSLLIAIPCEYSTEEAHPVYVPEEAARVVDGVYEEVDITKKKTSRAFANAKEHDLLDRLLADPYDAEIEIEA
jgi:radical SAM superfamily enzyme with C-terminal helix-hairpin-helix motif